MHRLACGRAENNILFGKNVALHATFFPKRRERGHLSHKKFAQKLSEKGWSWGYGPGAGVPASAGSGHTPAEAGTPGALSGGSGHPACRGTDANHLFRQSFRANFL